MLSAAGRSTSRLAVVALLVVAAAVLGAGATAGGAPKRHARSPACRTCVRSWPIKYRAHNGATRVAYVLLPRWYGPRRHPPIPLVISPHGRGVPARVNARMWRNLPALGSFAVVNPQGQGRVLRLFSWGYPGQIGDLARMPRIVHQALPWLRIDHRRIYAAGTSMGGQETLLLLARHPHLLAGAAAFDSVTDLRARYKAFWSLGCNAACLRRWKHRIGRGLRALARIEIGGPPGEYPRAYAVRSPQYFAKRIARSGVPLELWWSRSDRVVSHQSLQSKKLFATILRLNPNAPVEGFEGSWWHSSEMHTLLIPALVDLGLLPDRYLGTLTGVQRIVASRQARLVRRGAAWYG